MGAVRLGKISLKWCRTCNVPLVELEHCGLCGEETVPVEVTPPGDYRPAFPYDIECIRKTIDMCYGPGTGLAMILEGRLVVLNKCPAVDIMDEVVVDSQVLGSHVFEPVFGWRFICRLEGAVKISKLMTKSWAIIDEGAVPFIRKGSSSMAVGIMDADTEIAIGEDVIVITQDRKVVSTGRARMSGKEMVETERGPAVKSRWYKEFNSVELADEPRTWDDAVRANAPCLEKKRINAVNHIKKSVRRFNDLDVAVSISGGKDSLATLHLVLEAGITPKLIFTDTGLEFPETLENVQDTAKEHDLELFIENAGDAFWDAIEYFGPPAKDFRWCCKTCKLGPTANLIRSHFSKGVLSFIGQRQYESSQRFEKGNIWRNPWVPGQVGASPIQNWPSMLVWLYLFERGAKYNPLYEKGLERIGCWLCPATDLGEFDAVSEFSEQSERWQNALESFASQKNLPKEWIELGLWRWKQLPKGMGDFLTQYDRASVVKFLSNIPDASPRELTDEEKARVETFSCITEDEDSAMKKAVHCVGCGICLSRCENEALMISEGKVQVDQEKCNSCGRCLHPCTVIDFLPR